ncbi:MAG: hypothetical protein IKW78_05975 [Prevotella sp.]|nr:hypothetical protein [Prevotella sp.]MBR6016455.1 hypothetical protein [Prevotella sp.]
MKKTYFKPSIKVLMGLTDDLLTGSLNGNVDGNGSLGFGGVDAGGSKDPEAKGFDFEEDYSYNWED